MAVRWVHAVLLLVVLYGVEKRAANPIIPSFLFTNRTIAIANFMPMRTCLSFSSASVAQLRRWLPPELLRCSPFLAA